MKTKLILLLSVLLLPPKAMMGQSFEVADSTGAVKTDSFWSDWFVQMDLDMSLQNPYGYNFSHVFPNGKTFGIDLAVGKWFTPQVGVRGKLNWENGIGLFRNDHANWLAPFDEPGRNMDKGGYIAAYGDVLLNFHNFFGIYRPERVWNLSAYPRVGVNYNFGVSKGSLLIGAGVLNTYRLNDRWSLFADLAYVFTGSGFVGKTKEKHGTGTGSNSNGYFSIGLGAQIELGKTKGRTHLPNHTDSNTNDDEQKGVLTNGIWDNWFVQGGVDMSLMNPYGCNFSKTIPKGMTFGLNVAAGKWFSPEFGLRGRVQWENGLIENKNVEWVPPADDPRRNYKKGGLATFSLDAMLNMTNVLAHYDPERKWHTTAFVRAGVITQFIDGSGSPLMGIGVQESYKLNDRLSLFGSIGYQVSTSEGMGVSTTGMNVPAGSNGFFDIDLGVVYDLGRNKFYRSSQEKRVAYTQATCGRNWPRFILNTLASAGVAFAGKSALKAVISEERPDHSDNKSFPSGHAAIAFAGATSVHNEFGKDCPWVSVAAFAAATAVGVERVARDRHHWYDVLAGAGVGFGAAELTWWLSDKVFGKDNIGVGVGGNGVNMVVAF